jgi:hypothetical protein
LVLGIDHDGHRLEGSHEAWYRLLPQEDFLVDGTAWLRQLDEAALTTGSKAARDLAETSCSWTSSVEVLEALLQSFNSES